MGRKRKPRHRKQSRTQILAMMLIGSGLLLLGVLALLILPKPGATAKSNGSKGELVTPVEVDYRAPQLSLTDLAGQAVSLADYEGHLVPALQGRNAGADRLP